MITTGANVPIVTPTQLENAIQRHVVKSGRPSHYNEELAAIIIYRMENGEMPVAISKDSDMPAFSTIYSWSREIPGFGARMEEAKKVWTHAKNQSALKNLEDTPDDAPMSQVKRNEAIAKHTLELTSRMNANDYAPKQQIQMDVRSVQIKTSHAELAKLMSE